MDNKRNSLPVSFFAMPVGVLALANAWRVAVGVWALPKGVATALTGAGLSLWLLLLVAYAHKWLFHRAAARAELQHPLQSSFAALLPVASLLAALALLPWSRLVALGVFGGAISAQFALGLFLHGRFWQGGRPPELVTPAVYLPAVAQNFVAGTAAAVFGWPQLGAWLFGAGLLSWLAIESLILHHASVQDSLSVALRPTLGIQLAPPVVGGVTYMSLSSGTPDLFAQILLGYGLYQAALLLRLLPWIRQQAFGAGYWSFSFGVAALPTLAMRMVERGASGPVQGVAVASFIAANLIIGTLMLKTLGLLLRGKLLPGPAPVAATTAMQAAH